MSLSPKAVDSSSMCVLIFTFKLERPFSWNIINDDSHESAEAVNHFPVIQKKQQEALFDVGKLESQIRKRCIFNSIKFSRYDSYRCSREDTILTRPLLKELAETILQTLPSRSVFVIHEFKELICN